VPGPLDGGSATGPPPSITPRGQQPAFSHRTGKPSVTARPEFRMSWRDTIRLSPVVTTGEPEAEAAEAQRAKQPMLVFIYADGKAGRDPRFAVEEEEAFQDEQVAIGARFFDCVRMHANDAKRDRALKRYAGRAPCLVLLRPDYSAEKCLRGKLRAEAIFAAMKQTVQEDYENCLECTARAQDRLQDQRATVADAKADLAELKEGDSKRAALQAWIAETEKVLDLLEKDLYALKPKAA